MDVRQIFALFRYILQMRLFNQCLDVITDNVSGRFFYVAGDPWRAAKCAHLHKNIKILKKIDENSRNNRKKTSKIEKDGIQ